MNKRDFGKVGETTAGEFLKARGFEIIGRNVYVGRCEIDIISADSAGLHFVEVKSRKAPAAADPLVNVTAAKQKNMVQAALRYLHSEGRRFKDYLNFVRAEHALEDYLNFDIPVAEAALKNGFGHYNFFSKACIKYYGASPTALKKARRQQPGTVDMPLVRTA